MRTDEAFRQIFAENNRNLPESLLAALVADKQQKMLAIIEHNPPVAPGSQELVRALQKKYHLAVASSGSGPRVLLFLDKSGYGDAFDHVVTGSDVTRAKPDPEIYLLAAEKLGVDPADCVVIEDALSGVRAGVAAGMTVIAVGDGETPDTFLQAGASHVTPDLARIATLL
jgi:HAD superfamily hydrolase (TIGR01509 family)